MTEGQGERVERFRAIYDAAYPRVMAYALRRGRTREDALDVVSETFIVAWRRLDDIPDDVRRIPWVYGVARRGLAPHHRAGNPPAPPGARLENDPGSAAPGFDAVHEALDALRPDDREILTLSAWDDLDNDEIAVVLDITQDRKSTRLNSSHGYISY